MAERASSSDLAGAEDDPGGPSEYRLVEPNVVEPPPVESVWLPALADEESQSRPRRKRRPRRGPAEGPRPRPAGEPRTSGMVSLMGLLVPWYGENLFRWVGLSIFWLFTAVFTVGMAVYVGVALKFGAFLELFIIALPACAWLALVGYLSTCSIHLIEEAAADRPASGRLPTLSWDEGLPALLHVGGAAGPAATAAAGLGWLLARQGLLGDPRSWLVLAAVVLIVFPLSLIANLIQNSFLPGPALLVIIGGLYRYALEWLIFLAVTVLITVLAAGGLWAAWEWWSWGGLIATAAPIGAAWQMYVAYWMGRLQGVIWTRLFPARR